MSHVLLVGGQNLRPIEDLINREIRPGAEWWVGILLSADAASLNYHESHDPFPKLTARLSSGELASIEMMREDPSLLLGLYRPRFCGEPLNRWRCVVEAPDDEVASLYAACLKRGGISFVSLSVEETPDLDSDDVSVDNFPWDDWRLIRAAVRSENGEWVERKGLAKVNQGAE